MVPASEQPHAGWYADPAGVVRWWGGRPWGGARPTPADSAESTRRLLAALAHASFLLMPLLPAVVIRLLPPYRHDSPRGC